MRPWQQLEHQQQPQLRGPPNVATATHQETWTQQDMRAVHDADMSRKIVELLALKRSELAVQEATTSPSPSIDWPTPLSQDRRPPPPPPPPPPPQLAKAPQLQTLQATQPEPHVQRQFQRPQHLQQHQEQFQAQDAKGLCVQNPGQIATQSPQLQVLPAQQRLPPEPLLLQQQQQQQQQQQAPQISQQTPPQATYQPKETQIIPLRFTHQPLKNPPQFVASFPQAPVEDHGIEDSALQLLVQGAEVADDDEDEEEEEVKVIPCLLAGPPANSLH